MPQRLDGIEPGGAADREIAEEHADSRRKQERQQIDNWARGFVLVIEFQTEPDPFMALRLLVYVGLLYQDLLRRNELPADGRLPPVLPLVLYHGAAPWTGAVALQDLLAPQRRFGDLPPWVTDHLAAVETTQLEAWAEQIFDATNLEELLRRE